MVFQTIRHSIDPLGTNVRVVGHGNKQVNILRLNLNYNLNQISQNARCIEFLQCSIDQQMALEAPLLAVIDTDLDDVKSRINCGQSSAPTKLITCMQIHFNNLPNCVSVDFKNNELDHIVEVTLRDV